MIEPSIAADRLVHDTLKGEPVIAFSVSGGKDSAAATVATNAYLDLHGHPRSRRVLIHAISDRSNGARHPTNWPASPRPQALNSSLRAGARADWSSAGSSDLPMAKAATRTSRPTISSGRGARARSAFAHPR